MRSFETSKAAYGKRNTHGTRTGSIYRLVLLILFCFVCGPAGAAPDPNQLLKDMDNILRGSSHEMTVSLDVMTPRWQRHYTINVRMKGVDLAFARVLSPPKVEGQGFLRIRSRLWNYLPSAERTILIPTSMMLDNFMGSDFSNDDFVKLTYLPRDYSGKILGEEILEGFKVYHLELTPLPDAPVPYGKLEVWLRQTDAAPVRWVFYNDDMKKIRTLNYSDFRRFGSREVPSVWQMIDHVKKGETTTITILKAEYDLEIPDSVFTREQLEKYP